MQGWHDGAEAAGPDEEESEGEEEEGGNWGGGNLYGGYTVGCVEVVLLWSAGVVASLGIFGRAV